MPKANRNIGGGGITPKNFFCPKVHDKQYVVLEKKIIECSCTCIYNTILLLALSVSNYLLIVVI